MKKLIMALSVVAAATALNAATVTWGSGTISLVNGSQAAKGNVTVYVWESLSSDIYDQVKAGTLNVVTEFKKSGYGALGSTVLTADSSKRGIADVAGVVDATTPNGVYAVMLYVDNTATGDIKYTANYAYSGDVGTTGVTVNELANSVGGKIGTEAGWANAWTATGAIPTPEPTSGLLLLLGVAGLALKRKRA